jgi:PKD repeat protein
MLDIKTSQSMTGFMTALAVSTIAASIFFVHSPSFSSEQNPQHRTYGGPNLDRGIDVRQTVDGGYVAVGYTSSFGSGGEDVYVVRTDAAGDSLWTKTYGGEGDDNGWAVQETGDEGFMIAGFTDSYGSGAVDFYVIRTDALGDTLWTRTYGGEGDEYCWDMDRTDDGGYILAGETGETGSYGSGDKDFFLVRIDTQGTLLWSQSYGGPETDRGYSVRQTTDGGYIIVGSTTSFGAGDIDAYVVKTDAEGVLQWSQTYGTEAFDMGHDVRQTTDGGYIIFGYTESYGAAGRDVQLIKTDDTGNTVWIKTFGGSDEDHAVRGLQTADDGYLAVGYTRSYGAGHWDVYLLRTDSSGLEIWTQVFGGPDYDEGYTVCESREGNYIVTGRTQSYGAGNFDLWLFEVSSLYPQFEAEPLTGHAPLEVSFTDRSTGGDIAWRWDFNTDGTVDSEEQHPAWMYEEPGIYSVSLEIVTDVRSESAIAEDFIHVFDGESALWFDGDRSYVQCQAAPSLHLTGTLTIEAWINPVSWGAFPAIGLGRIVDKKNISLYLVDSYLSFHNQSLVLQLIHADGTVSYSNTLPQSIVLDEWQHVAATYNGWNVVGMYIDGVEQNVTYMTPPSDLILDHSDEDFIIGNSSNPGWTFNGRIDEVRIWDVARTGEDIRGNMIEYLSGDESGLVGYWRMNEGSGDSIVDMSVHGNNGLVVEALWRTGVRLDPLSNDGDGDGVVDGEDNCPDDYNPEQDDGDGDGVGDICDNCGEDFNPEQGDADADAEGDACDSCTDTDGDGYGDPGYLSNTCDEDNCPEVYNPDQSEVERGDINCEGGINVLDVLAAVNHILGIVPLTGGPLDRADCNDDEAINILDALSIINVILGIGECGPSAASFRFPLNEYVVSQDFGNFYGPANRYHAGEDVIGTPGTPVYAIADGSISHSGWILGYGWAMTIDHQSPEVYSLYGHLSTRRWKKTSGGVTRGELIAYLGDGDEISGLVDWLEPHLHFGIRRGSRYEYPSNASDNRWTAGYTYAYPTELGWLDPTDFIQEHIP